MPPASSPPAPIITAANHGRLIASVNACLGRKVAVIYKHPPVDTFMQIEGILLSMDGHFYVGPDGGAPAMVRFGEYGITGFVPAGQPVTVSKLPVIYIR